MAPPCPPAAQETRGYEILRGAVPMSTVDRALRHLDLDLVQNGSSAVPLGRWLWSAHWFPHLKWDAEIVLQIPWAVLESNQRPWD